jgi:hypothetical protein
MNPRIYRALFLAVALGLTLLVFSLWGEFGRAIGVYMTIVTKDDPPKPTGVVTMSIIQPKAACGQDKKEQCPKP